MKFSTTTEAQAKRKFWALYILAFVGISAAYWGGYRMGKYQENKEWLEIVNPEIAKERIEKSVHIGQTPIPQQYTIESAYCP
jgi:hypothetical protein